MAQNHVQKGEVLEWTNGTGSDVASGGPVVIGTLVGVALVDIADGEKGNVAIKEVWRHAKLAGNAFVQGAVCYLTPGGSITPTATDNTYAGKAADAAASADTEIDVLLNV